jgi:hypothetical protein
VLSWDFDRDGERIVLGFNLATADWHGKKNPSSQLSEFTGCETENAFALTLPCDTIGKSEMASLEFLRERGASYHILVLCAFLLLFY